MKITDEQVQAAELVSSDVYDGKISPSKGAEKLASDHGININSAKDYINDYKRMMQGRVFQRAMSASAIDHFLSRIRDSRGPKYHALAVSAVDQHIAYYEGYSKSTLHSMRSVVDSHRESAAPLQLADQQTSFQEAVLESIQDSPSSRKARLAKAAKIPTKIPVISFAYARNPDVVAEVLVRANGKCERCNQDAPFLRKKDHEPYLEVHHVIQLSHGGEDTVNNALALCPNCHRFLHFGLVSALSPET